MEGLEFRPPKQKGRVRSGKQNVYAQANRRAVYAQAVYAQCTLRLRSKA